jgi:hypothetical protein
MKSVKLKACRFCGCQRVWPCLALNDANLCPDYFSTQNEDEANAALADIGDDLPQNVTFTRCLGIET